MPFLYVERWELPQWVPRSPCLVPKSNKEGKFCQALLTPEACPTSGPRGERAFTAAFQAEDKEKTLRALEWGQVTYKEKIRKARQQSTPPPPPQPTPGVVGQTV